MFLRFCQILGISSQCAHSVLRLCSECVQSVFRVCSILKSFHPLAHLVCQFLAFFDIVLMQVRSHPCFSSQTKCSKIPQRSWDGTLPMNVLGGLWGRWGHPERAAVLAGLPPLPRAQTARLGLACVHNTLHAF